MPGLTDEAPDGPFASGLISPQCAFNSSMLQILVVVTPKKIVATREDQFAQDEEGDHLIFWSGEPLRVCRRLQLLRDWSHDERTKIPKVFARAA